MAAHCMEIGLPRLCLNSGTGVRVGGNVSSVQVTTYDPEGEMTKMVVPYFQPCLFVPSGPTRNVSFSVNVFCQKIDFNINISVKRQKDS